VKDRLLNEGSTIYVDGDTFFETRSRVEDVLASNPDVNPGELGYVWGLFYGARSAGVAAPGFFDDILSGRMTFDDILAGLGQLPHVMTHIGEAYDAAYIDYMTNLALSINPFAPTLEDLENLQSNETMYWMRDTGAQEEGASPWLKFAKAFWDGSVAGGIVGTVVLAVASAGVGAAVMGAIKGIKIVADLIKSLKSLVGSVLKIVKNVIVSAAKLAYKVTTVVAARLWTVMQPVVQPAASWLAGIFKAAAREVDGVSQRAFQWFARNEATVTRAACVIIVVASCAGGAPPPVGLGAVLSKAARNSQRASTKVFDDTTDVAKALDNFKVAALRTRFGLNDASMKVIKEAVTNGGKKIDDIERFFDDLVDPAKGVGLKVDISDFNRILRAPNKVEMRARIFEEAAWTKRVTEAGGDATKVLKRQYSRLDDADGNTYRGYVDALDNHQMQFVEVKSGTFESIKKGFSKGGRDLEQFRKYERLHDPDVYKPRISVSKEAKKAIDEGGLDSKHPLSQIIKKYGKEVIEEGPSQLQVDSWVESAFKHLPSMIGG
jgi:hypothetical protein